MDQPRGGETAPQTPLTGGSGQGPCSENGGAVLLGNDFNTCYDQGWRVGFGVVGVEIFLGSLSQSWSRKIMLARVESRSQKICSTLTSNLLEDWKAFYAMNKLPKYQSCPERRILFLIPFQT